MEKSRVKALLATGAIALSLSACQWMGMGEEGGGAQTSGAQTSGMARSGAAQQSGSGEVQALSSNLVQDVQRTLGQRGFDVGPVDGVYGESTASAVRNFQETNNLRPTGRLDRQTLAALGIDMSAQAQSQQPQRAQSPPQQQQPYASTTRRGASNQAAPRTRQQAGLPPDMLRDVQQELQDRGYRVGQVDGMWGPSTQQAVRDFQRDQQMQPSGQLDRQTLSALGVEGAGTQTGQTPREPDAAESPSPQTAPAD